MKFIGNFFKTEWAKLSQMNFTDKRQYIWEYYRLHIFGIAALTFFVGSMLNTMIFNPPRQEYVYFVWVGPFVTAGMLDEFAQELDVIVENPDRYMVRAANYNLEGLDPQMIMGLQTRFIAQMQQRLLDLFVLSGDNLYDFSASGFVLPFRHFMSVVEETNPAVHEILKERLVEVTFYHEDYGLITEYMAADLYGVPFIEKFGIHTDDLYLAIVINSQRFERVIRALEVLLDV